MNRITNDKGFTLIEALVAVAILSIGILAVAGMQTTAMSTNLAAMNSTKAVNLAEEMVDRIRLNAGNTPNIYNGIDTANGCSGIDTRWAFGDCSQWNTKLQNSGLVSPRGQVSVSTDSPIPFTATISVTVTWGAGITRSVTFTTIMSTWLT